MPMDKSWTTIKNRKSHAFMNGVKEFVEHVLNFMDSSGKVQCPCKKCVNLTFENFVLSGLTFCKMAFTNFIHNGFSTISHFKIQYMRSLQLRRMWTK